MKSVSMNQCMNQPYQDYISCFNCHISSTSLMVNYKHRLQK